MIKIMTMTDAEVLDLHPSDVLVCEKCGFEIPISASPDGHAYCPKCTRAWDKQNFSPFVRKQRVWVSKKGLEILRERRAKPFKCDCTRYYRAAIRFRRAIFEVYRKQGEITEAQAVGMFISFYAGFEEGVLRLLGKDRESVKPRLQRSGPFYAALEKLEKDDKFGRNDPNKGFLFEWLGNIAIARVPGRPARTDSLVLLLDAIILAFCPNAYLHFLRDALTLRRQEYQVVENHATANRERWDKFRKAQRAVEVGCKRIWRGIFGKNPDPPSQRLVGTGSKRRREEWWERVALKQGLMGNLLASP